MSFRALWRGVLHSIGLAPLSELREAEDAKRRAFEAAVHARVAEAGRGAEQRLERLRVERLDAMQRQERPEPCRDGDPHDF